MKQVVKVLSLNPDGTAEVVGRRESACGGNCAHCGGCGEGQNTIQVTARNPLGAKPGDMAVLESSTGEVLALAWLVYLLPVVLLLVGCAVKGLLGGLGGLALGAAAVVALDRLRKNRISHTIVEIVNPFDAI